MNKADLTGYTGRMEFTMKETYKTLVKSYNYKGNEYVIAKGLHDGIIRAINYKYIIEDGKLVKPLNGIEMFCSKEANTVEDIIKRINDKIDFDEYIKKYNIGTDDISVLARAYKKFYERSESKEGTFVQKGGRSL